MRRNKRRGQRREQKLDLFREFLRLVEEMAYDVDAAIVEGRHDEKTLRMSGFGKPIVRCSQTKRSFQELVDYIARRFSRVVILADFDEKGEEISNRLATHLERRGIAVEKSYRQRLGKIAKDLRIHTIEAVYGVKKELFG